MGKVIFLFLILFGSLKMGAQTTIELGRIPKEVQTDAFGNAYVILEDGAIQKFNSKGILVSNFRESGWGVPSQLDVLNPLNPIVFYSGRGFLQEFDNNLTPIFQLSLEGGFTNSSLVARSSDGLFWWYRERDRTLVKINRNGQIILEGGTLDFFDFPQSILPKLLFETAEKNSLRIQLYDPQLGLLTFGSNAQFLLRRGDVRMDAWYRCGKNWGYFFQGKKFDGEVVSRIPATSIPCSGVWRISGSQLIKDE